MKENSVADHPGLLEKLSKAIDHSEVDEQNYLHFRYELGFRPKLEGMLLWVYQGSKNVTRFEQYGIHALGLGQQGTPQSELAPEHRRLVQNLLRFARLNASEGFYHIPKKHVAFFMQRLVRFRDVSMADSSEVIQFSEHLLTALISLEEHQANRILLKASFADEETGEAFAYSQARVFLGRRAWAMVGSKIFSIKSSPLVTLLEDFDEYGNLLLTGNEAADFIQDYLPLLSKKPQMQLPENFDVPKVLQEACKTHYEIQEEQGGEKLVLTIEFAYGGHRIPPHQNDEEVLVEVPVEAKKVLIRRDLAAEKQILKEFYDQGFRRVGPTRFETLGQEAYDFISESLPELQKTAAIKGSDSLTHLNLFGEIGEGQVKAKVNTTGMDWLELSLGFEVGGVEVPYEVVQNLVAQGKKYLKLPEQGFVKINVDEVNRVEEKIAELEGQIDESGQLKLSQYHAFYLEDIFKMDWDQRQDIGQMIQSLKKVEGIPAMPLPENLQATLRDYQHRGFDWLSFLHEHQFHGTLADDMGLGKTVQALSFLLHQRNQQGRQPCLVLAPTSVVFNWAAEAKKFAPDLKVLTLSGPQRKEYFGHLNDYDLIITSYALFRRDFEVLSGVVWRTVILDEAQNIKNYRSKTALLVKDLRATQRWALSGTPLENRLSELWSIFDFLMPGFLGSYPHFQRKYQQPIEVHQSGEHLERLRRRIYPFVLRRLKDDVASELPPKTEITSYCEMTAGQRKLYEEVLEACRRHVFTEVEKRGIEKSQVSILTALLRLRQVCCHPELMGPSFQKRGIQSGKMEALKDLILEIIDEGHRLLVFSQFVEMLGIIRGWLEESKINFEYLDGRTRRREERVRRFNENDDIPVFLVSLRAGGTGLNLTGASYVIHFDPWWNPAVQDQATDRVHRIGQKKHVFSYKLIAKDSVEEKILALQERKRSLAKELLSAEATLGKKLTVQDLEYLFS